MYTFVYLGLTWTSNHACSLSPVTKITLNVDKGIIIYWAHFQWSIVSFNLLSRTLNTCKSGSTIISLYASISRHNISPHVTGEPKTIMDSGFHVLDSGFQLWKRFRNPWTVFRIPKARIPNSKQKFHGNSTVKSTFLCAAHFVVMAKAIMGKRVHWTISPSRWKALVTIHNGA